MQLIALSKILKVVRKKIPQRAYLTISDFETYIKILIIINRENVVQLIYSLLLIYVENNYLIHDIFSI